MKRVSAAGFVWAGAVFVVTAIIGIVLIAISVGTIASTVGDFEEVDVPGERTVLLDEGEQWIFVGRPDGSTINLSQVGVRVVDPDGDPVDIDLDSSYSADSSDNDFESLGKFDVDRSGRYTIDTQGPSGATVRVGEIPFGRILGFLIGGIAIGAIGFLVALALLIATIVRRTRAKREAQRAGWGAPGAPGGPPAPGAPGVAPQPYGAPPAPPAPPASPSPPVPPPGATPPPPPTPPPGSTPPPSPTS